MTLADQIEAIACAVADPHAQAALRALVPEARALGCRVARQEARLAGITAALAEQDADAPAVIPFRPRLVVPA